MERIFAFTDEYGAFGWDIENPNVSTHFIISAVLVKESDLDAFRTSAEAIRKKYFQSGEIKSKTTGNKHSKRIKILEEIKNLPFSIFAVCINKKSCIENMTMKGLLYKKSFYKFMNNIVHSELRRSFKYLTVVADEMIDNDYMQSFCRYFDEHQDIKTFWGEADFQYFSSKADVGIQIADYISGSLARVYDTHKHTPDTPDYYSILKEKITHIEFYPRDYKSFNLDTSAIAQDYDKRIAELCFSRIAAYVDSHDDDQDEYTRARVLVSKHLLFRFMNNDIRGYIPTRELLERIQSAGLPIKSERAFRQEIIGKLRDEGVILASSSKGGYKIPSKEAELYDYVNHDANIIIPMLARLKKCRDTIKLGTSNELDLLNHPEFQLLKSYFDSVDEPQ